MSPDWLHALGEGLGLEPSVLWSAMDTWGGELRAHQVRYTAVLMRKVVGNSRPKFASWGSSSLLRYLRPPTSLSYHILLVPSLKMPVSSMGESKIPHMPIILHQHPRASHHVK